MHQPLPPILLLAATLFACALPGGAPQEDLGPPNILFIIVDDQSPFDLSVYDPSSPLDTPVIDSLAAEGMTLDGVSPEELEQAVRDALPEAARDGAVVHRGRWGFCVRG